MATGEMDAYAKYAHDKASEFVHSIGGFVEDSVFYRSLKIAYLAGYAEGVRTANQVIRAELKDE